MNQPISRRHALALLAAVPVAARLGAQPRSLSLRRVIPGSLHNLLLEPDGTLKVWSANRGRSAPNAEDELGLGHNNPVQIYTAYPVPGLTNIVSAAAGRESSFAVRADGKLLSWGVKSNGILGITPLSELEVNDFPRPSSNAPVSVATPFDAVDVSVQRDHVLALARDGAVYAWGLGTEGQLGIGPLPVIKFKTHAPGAMMYVPFPVRIPDLADVVAISAGYAHSLALLKDGTVRAWGANKLGQVGDGTTMNRDRPVAVPGIRTAVAIAAGAEFSVAALADGTVMTWGTTCNGTPGTRPGLRMTAPTRFPHPCPGCEAFARSVRASLTSLPSRRLGPSPPGERTPTANWAAAVAPRAHQPRSRG